MVILIHPIEFLIGTTLDPLSCPLWFRGSCLFPSQARGKRNVFTGRNKLVSHHRRGHVGGEIQIYYWQLQKPSWEDQRMLEVNLFQCEWARGFEDEVATGDLSKKNKRGGLGIATGFELRRVPELQRSSQHKGKIHTEGGAELNALAPIVETHRRAPNISTKANITWTFTWLCESHISTPDIQEKLAKMSIIAAVGVFGSQIRANSQSRTCQQELLES